MESFSNSLFCSTFNTNLVWKRPYQWTYFQISWSKTKIHDSLNRQRSFEIWVPLLYGLASKNHEKRLSRIAWHCRTVHQEVPRVWFEITLIYKFREWWNIQSNPFQMWKCTNADFTNMVPAGTSYTPWTTWVVSGSLLKIAHLWWDIWKTWTLKEIDS